MKFEIEFDPEIVPKGYNPTEYRRPKIGEHILIFNSDGEPMVIRNSGNIHYGPVIILEIYDVLSTK